MFSTSSKARNNRNFAAAYCSASVRARPCEAAQLLIAASKRNTLTAKVVFLSDVTSKMNSVAGALASLARAARLPTKRSEEHTSELQSRREVGCSVLLE